MQLDQPPFRLVPGMDAHATAQQIVASINWFEGLPQPLPAAFSSAMETIGLAPQDPLCRAAWEVVGEMTRGVGAGAGNAYHNVQHFCEVMLCTLYIAQLARLTQREQAQVLVAALLHDFHHDGCVNGVNPFRLELMACARAERYFRQAGMDVEEQARLRALILCTEITVGMPTARNSYARHFLDGDSSASDTWLRPGPGSPRPEMSALAIDARLALQAVILGEGDLLPSFGLTVAHADRNEARLAAELKQPLGPLNKIAFIDHCLKEFLVASFFSPNLRRIRQANVERLQRM
ncbi:MAG: hypothetical protein ACRYGK_14250 [Janthinobacterium lividum]